MADEKDRFGEKIHQSEKAREDQWARQQDAELLENPREEGRRRRRDAMSEVREGADPEASRDSPHTGVSTERRRMD